VILDEARFEIAEQTLSAAKARDTLGWAPAWTLDAGLLETLDWYRRHLGLGAAPALSDAFR
jgi:nucleoside-diphosphate-sugar epimerase